MRAPLPPPWWKPGSATSDRLAFTAPARPPADRLTARPTARLEGPPRAGFAPEASTGLDSPGLGSQPQRQARLASSQLPALLRPARGHSASRTTAGARDWPGAGWEGLGLGRDGEIARLLPAAVPAGRSALGAQGSAPSKAPSGTGPWTGPEAAAPAGLSWADPQPTTPGCQEPQVFPGFLPTLVSF